MDQKVQKVASSIPKAKTKTKKIKEEENPSYSQDYIGIREIIGNTIFLNNGRAVGILEVIPINFFQIHNKERNDITDEYMTMYRGAPIKMHIKVRTEKADTNKIIWNIRKETQNETNPQTISQIEDYIAHIQKLRGNSSISQKFYIIYEYEGDAEGKRSSNKEEIAETMYENKHNLANTLKSLGNIVLEFTPEEEEQHVRNILYKFYNPISYETESLEQREERILRDKELYNQSVPEKYRKIVTESDFIAPRGLDLTHANYVILDGEYQTFLAIRSVGFPSVSYGSWITNITKAPGIDYDIYSVRLPHTKTLGIVEQMNRWNRVTLNDKKTQGKQEKIAEILGNINNINGIVDRMKNCDEDMFMVMVFITIRSKSYKTMMKLRNGIAKALENHSIYTLNSFLQAGRFFQMAQPLMEIDQSLFDLCKRNFLTSSMASLYCFTAYELFSDTGYVLGTNDKNSSFGSLVSFDNFDTSMYANANILIIGSSGSGKTFTEEMLAYRMRMTGVRTMFIIPSKGKTDYLRGCQNIGGEFITLAPSSPNHINIMEIRPVAENKLDKVFADGGASADNLSLLSSKINSVLAFISLLMQREEMTLAENSILGVYLAKTYAMYGITNDNDSIWMDETHTMLKPMPTLSDLVAVINQDPKLERILAVLDLVVHGDYQALNQPTNVDLTNRYIVFDVDDALVNENMLPAFLYVAFDCAYSLAKESLFSKDAVFLDEVWKLMINEQSAKQVQNMVKLIRAYGACTVMATQDLEDFLGKTGDFGASVINNTENKIFMKLSEKEIKLVGEIIDFTDEDEKTLKSLHHQGMIFSGGNKVICNFLPSDREEEAFTTDVNRRREIVEKMERERQMKSIN